MTVLYSQTDTKIGPMTIMATDDSVVRIDYGTDAEPDDRLMRWKARYMPERTLIQGNNDVMKWVRAELDEYFNGERFVFTFPFHYYGTPFQTQVWDALYTIPFGTTQTYKDIAETIQNPRAVRAVGGAVNKNPLSIVVPCHRVVGANGKLVGYGGGIDKKTFLLEHEGVQGMR